MEYITERNRIYAVENGEEVGEVTFPLRDDVYVINHTYVDDRLRGQGGSFEVLQRGHNEGRRHTRKIRKALDG